MFDRNDHRRVGSNEPTKRRRSYEPLDALRLICALCVVLTHTRPDTGPWGRLLYASFNGGWAVMAFFVISGLCIHAPYIGGRSLNARSFYLSRACRIVIPLLAAMLFAHVFTSGPRALETVLWSLYCELVYYAAYPLLLLLMRHVGTSRVLLVSYVAAVVVAYGSTANNGFFSGQGVWRTAMLGLPIWTLGCFLAEYLDKPLDMRQWAPPLEWLRYSVFLAGMLLGVLQSNAIFTETYSFLLFSPLLFFWLSSELSQTRVSPLLSNLNPFGVATYSVYLMHIFALLLDLGPYANWLLTEISVAVLSTLFFWLVERPSHKLARIVAHG